MLFTLGLRTGFRISELLSIKVCDVLEHDGTIKDSIVVARARMKGKKKSRSVPLNEETKVLLKAYIHSLPEQEYLFTSRKGGSLDRTMAWRIIKAAAKRAKVTGKVGCHSTRKTIANRAYKASGNDLVLTQRLLGHTSIQSTISYLGIEPENLKDVWKEVQK